VLGHINLIQTNTNRNDDNGAWQWDIHEKGNLETIDWNLFLGNAPKIPFNPEHYFRWRKWWAYGTGLSGDLLTHDYDRINCVLEMGIPATCSASGGIYTHNDGRDVPDVLQVLIKRAGNAGTDERLGLRSANLPHLRQPQLPMFFMNRGWAPAVYPGSFVARI